MAGVAANVSSLNTVVTYDLVQPYLKKDAPDAYYLRVGRMVTVVGVVIAIFTALLASQFNNIMNYLQALFGIFNAPIFATFILGMFWKRTTAKAGFAGLLVGVLSGATVFLLYETNVLTFGSALSATFAEAGVAFGLDAIVTIAVSLMEPAPGPDKINGLVRGAPGRDGKPLPRTPREPIWWRRVGLLGGGALAIGFVLNLLFA
jgi:SSS family solute:Na+ symporter